MASTFLGLSIANRGLNAAQVGLATTTNNISNIDTTGYSRQVLNQTSIGPAAVYSRSLVGGGVDVTSVDRVRSFRLDQKYWQENSAASELESQSTYLEQVENVFGSTSSSYITTDYNAFCTAMEKVTSDSTNSDSTRASLLTAAQTLCNTINSASNDLTQIRKDINADVKTTVAQINSYATQIAELNKKISVATAAGASTNELEDQRGVLVDKLSSLVGIDVTESSNGQYDITVNGARLVSGDDTNQLECYTVTDTASNSYGMYGIRWSETGAEFDTGDSGALNGYLEVRDGNSADSKGIPYYISQLDEFARTFAQAFNEGVTVGTTTYSGHAGGVGLDDTTGTRFFSYDNLSSADLMASGTDTDAVYQNITAANISISKDIKEDLNKIAASSATGEDANTDNLDDLISICEKANVSESCTVSDLYKVIVEDIASNSASAQASYERQNTRATYINTSRTSVSGVSDNEETINMTVYQSAYEASAKMVSTWSQIYDTTINMVDD